jgi:hypothetical protein
MVLSWSKMSMTHMPACQPCIVGHLEGVIDAGIEGCEARPFDVAH